MLPEVPLNFQPSINSCLAWSDDGELAVAAGEFVHVLIPRRSRPRQERGNNASDPWVQIHIRTNTFTWDEWPLQQPSSFNDFSVGEEQSISSVIAIAWSPPGLARNRRSVLAVLTSNLVLSFWASNANVSMLASWKRVFVVNNGIRASLERKSRLSRTSNPTDSVPRRVLRIRSVAWAPLMHRDLGNAGTRFSGTAKLYFLAVTTDDDSVLFLSVSSPYIHNCTYWDVSIIGQYAFDRKNPMIKGISTLQAVEEGPGSEPTGCQGQSDTQQESLYGRGSLLYAALKTKRFIDRVSWGAWIQANAFAEISVNFEKDNASIGTGRLYVSFDLPSRISLSKISGALPTSPYIYNYEALDINSFGLPNSALHKQALQLRAAYDRQNDYGGLTVVKCWGLATYKEYAAICVTLHPGDMVDYLLASEERATILFSSWDNNCLNTELEAFVWESDSGSGETATAQRAILKVIFDNEMQSALDLAGLGYRIIYAAACASMLLWDAERVQHLSFAKTVLERLEQKTGIDLGLEINACSRLLKSPNVETEEAAAVVAEATGARNKKDLATAVQIFDVCLISRCALTFLAIKEPGISKYCEKCQREFLNEHFLRESGQYPELFSAHETEESTLYDCPTDEDQVGGEWQDSYLQRVDDNGVVGELRPTGLEGAPQHTSQAISLAYMLFNEFDVCPYCQGKFVG